MELFTPHPPASSRTANASPAPWGLDAASYARRQAHADRLAEQTLQRDPSGARARPFSVRVSPLRIAEGEWAVLKAGVLQRLRAFSALIEDVYGKRNLLRDGILPPEIIYEDPFFFPELHGMLSTRGGAPVFAAVDLVRAPSGEWQVVENRFSTPTGIGRLLQARRILASSLPEAFRAEAIQPVQSFPARLYEHLSEAGLNAPPSAQIVLLSEGPESPNLQEEELLAREMGIPVAHSHDLLVRNGRLYLRTIEGLDQVGILYRRMEPPWLDPVGFSANKFAGVPGLLHCIRQNTVRVLNPPECAVADNRALLRHADAIIRYYCRETPLLRTVPTFYGYDRDQAEWIDDHRDALVLKPVCHPALLEQAGTSPGPDLKALLKKDPRRVVGQAYPAPEGGSAENDPKGHSLLRLFILGGAHPYVLTGGLCRFRAITDAPAPQPEALRDTWVTGGSARTGIEPLEPQLASRPRPLPSGIAENLYWFGRYLERGLSGCRMLALVDPWEQRSASDGPDAPEVTLGDGILAALEVTVSERAEMASLRAFLQPHRHPNSPLSAFLGAQAAMRALRGTLSETACLAVDAMVAKLEHLCTAEPDFRPELLFRMGSDGDAIIGNLQRTLLRDSGWHFFITGHLLERGSLLSALSSAVLPKIVRRMDWHLQDEADLNSFLKLTGCLHLYHRIYHSRAFLDRTLQLIWQSEACPGSIAHCLLGIRTSLGEIDNQFLRESAPIESQAILDEVRQWLTSLRIETIIPARGDKGLSPHSLSLLEKRAITEIRNVSERLSDTFTSLHTALDNRFFCHQSDTPSAFHHAFLG